uniref:Uncharacterized protein n=1 Tax=Oryza nivara TaxID=4536 RepID=A0A0E0HXW3_ORYNI
MGRTLCCLWARPQQNAQIGWACAGLDKTPFEGPSRQRERRRGRYLYPPPPLHSTPLLIHSLSPPPATSPPRPPHLTSPEFPPGTLPSPSLAPPSGSAVS